MKKLIPVITLTTLAAAAFADATAPAAPVAGLTYNRVGISRSGDNTNVSVSNLLNGGNVLLTVASGFDGEGASSSSNASQVALFSVGYVFKNVVQGIDVTASLGGSTNNYQSGYAINLRRSLSEVTPGLEGALCYGHQKYSSDNAYTFVSYELSYNINKQFSVAYGINVPSGDNTNVNTVSVRYNY